MEKFACFVVVVLCPVQFIHPSLVWNDKAGGISSSVDALDILKEKGSRKKEKFPNGKLHHIFIFLTMNYQIQEIDYKCGTVCVTLGKPIFCQLIQSSFVRRWG